MDIKVTLTSGIILSKTAFWTIWTIFQGTCETFTCQLLISDIFLYYDVYLFVVWLYLYIFSHGRSEINISIL